MIFIHSYIRDNQVYGDCTPETYIHALRTGCRAVECKYLFSLKISYFMKHDLKEILKYKVDQSIESDKNHYRIIIIVCLISTRLEY